MIKNLLLVGAGGAIGSIARYLCQRWFSLQGYSHLYLGTFTVNLVGCFLIGIFWGLSFRGFSYNEHWKLLLMTGYCGGFTTFSAFTQEGTMLLKQNRLGLFFLYAAGTVVAGFICTYLGMKITRG